MTGPEHYREAERLLEIVPYNADLAAAGRAATPRDVLLALAQAHATLAAAAATATAAGLVEYRNGQTAGWDGRAVLV